MLRVFSEHTLLGVTLYLPDQGLAQYSQETLLKGHGFRAAKGNREQEDRRTCVGNDQYPIKKSLGEAAHS